MKKLIIPIVVAILLGVVWFFRGENSKKYEGVGIGYGGEIKVQLEVDKNRIEKINILESNETDFTKEVFEEIIDKVITEQTVDIDYVAGGSVTSKGLLDAITEAALKSDLKLAARPIKKEEPIVEPETKVESRNVTTDVLVIGGGGAGLTASIASHEAGVKVILIDKMPILGGNTNFATGGINAANTKLQKELGIEDSEDIFFEDTLKGGRYKNDKELLKVMVDNSKDIIDWLKERGADITEIGISGGQSVKRFHRPTGGKKVGPAIVGPLSGLLVENAIDTRMNTRATELIVENDVVVGAKVVDNDGEYEIFAKSVVVTTGGFGANPEMVIEYKPELEGFGSTNSPAITGEGIKMIKAIGGKLVDMEEIQIHPTVVHTKTNMITESVRGEGALLVNREGQRFIDELKTRDVVSKAELEQTGKSVFLLFDQEVRDKLKAIEGYVNAGFTTEGETLEALAKKIGVESDELVKTIEKYNEDVAAGSDTVFGRETGLKAISVAPFYAIEVSPAVHHTMGGVAINTSTEVIGENGAAIKGLYAAGEVTGGIHGGNRLGGNAVTDITVFGKIAGENAAIHAKSKK